MWDLWWAKWHWDTFLSKYFRFPTAVSFYQCPIIMLCKWTFYKLRIWQSCWMKHFSVSLLHFSVSHLHFSVSLVHFSVSHLLFSVSLIHFSVSHLHFSVSHLHFSVSLSYTSLFLSYTSLSLTYTSLSLTYTSLSLTYTSLSLTYLSLSPSFPLSGHPSSYLYIQLATLRQPMYLICARMRISCCWIILDRLMIWLSSWYQPTWR